MKNSVEDSSTIADQVHRGRHDDQAFQQWFAGSRVVDSQGRPVVAYHGTASDFRVFDTALAGRNYGYRFKGKGLFFVSNPGTASVYAEQPAFAMLDPKAIQEPRFGNGTANIMPVYLRICRPLVIRTGKSPDRYLDGRHSAIFERAGRAQADGIIVHGVGEQYSRTIYVVFEPTQVKSAIGNRGTYDVQDPDITHSRVSRDSDATQGRAKYGLLSAYDESRVDDDDDVESMYRFSMRG